MAYDRADWHYGGDFPGDLPAESAGTHIGMFLSWAIRRDLVGTFHLQESAEAVAAVRAGRMNGREFLIRMCDDKFWNEDLSDEGNQFAQVYYLERYLDDYMECLGTPEVATPYHVENSAENQARIDAVLDERLAAWRREQGSGADAARDEPRAPAAPKSRRRGRPGMSASPPKKPWWRFW